MALESDGSAAASQAMGSEWWKTGSTQIHFQQDNPKRSGTKAHERYAKYSIAVTVQAARELGATTADLRADSENGFLVLVDPPGGMSADVGMGEDGTKSSGMTPEAKRSRLEEMRVKLEKS